MRAIAYLATGLVVSPLPASEDEREHPVPIQMAMVSVLMGQGFTGDTGAGFDDPPLAVIVEPDRRIAAVELSEHHSPIRPERR